MVLEQPRVPLGLCPVRWIEVVSALEHLEAEIRERRSETIGHEPVVRRVAEPTQHEEDGGSECMPVRGREREQFESRRERTGPVRTARHLRRRGTGWRIRRFGAGCETG